MALLQISEPGMSPIPHQRRTAIGIDLGTSNSLVAVVRSSIPQVLHLPEQSPLVPSVVHFAADGSLQIGKSALPFLTTDPENTVYSAKRLLGRGITDVAALGLPYVCTQSDSGVHIQTVQGSIEPITISAHILATLRQKAEDLLSEDLVGAVITVPAYFDDAQRQATLDAAKLARIDVLRLLNEPTAAALAYGLDKGVEGVYAVYDLGGGTFDVSILRLQAGVFEVVATAGNTALGGDDFDRLLLDWLYTQIAFDQQVSSVKAAWLAVAKQLREAFSSESATASQEISATSLVVHFQKTVQQERVQAVTIEVHSEQRVRHSIVLTRETLEEMCAPLVDQTLAVVQRALTDAQLDVSAIQGVVMVGGATRMPLIQDAVQQFFHRPPLIDLNPDEVVALGAALQANILAGNRTDKDWLLLDVLPLSLGLEVMGGLVERIIPRNSAIPVARAQEFTTFKDGQTAMALHVVQGEREIVSECRSLARLELQGIPPMVAGAARIRVTFQVDADGLLSVNAREESSGVSTHVVVQPSYGLTDEQMRLMLEDGMQKAEEDKEERVMRELRVDAERLLVSVHSALAEDADLLASEERSAIDAALANVQAQLSSSERSPLQAAIDTLAVLTTPFAEARMNRSIRRVLEGKKIQELS